MNKILFALLIGLTITLGTANVDAKTTKKSNKSTSSTASKSNPLEFQNGIAIVAGHTYVTPVPDGKIIWYFNPNGRLKMTYKKTSGLGYWEQRGTAFQFYGEDYNFMGYGELSDDGKTIYIIPIDGTEEFEIYFEK